MPDHVWFDVRIEFYDQPESRTGYRGAATRDGFRSVCLPRVGELLVSPSIIVGDLPGLRVSSVDHMIDTVHDLEGGESRGMRQREPGGPRLSPNPGLVLHRAESDICLSM